MEPLTPIYTAELFPLLHAELIGLLRSLRENDWALPTVAGSWRVRDIVGHLLDIDLRRLAGARDGHQSSARPMSPAFADIVAFLNDLNASGVRYAERLSPRLMMDLLEVTGSWVAEFFASLPPHADAPYAVAWADEERSENWMDIGRDYTERWHHQAQIRDAVGAQGLLQKQWLYPLLDLSVRAFPRAYKDVAAPTGTTVVFEVAGDAEYAWSATVEPAGWIVMRGRAPAPAASLHADADTAWKLLYNALPPDLVRARATIAGDASLVEPMLAARSVMV